MWLLLRHLSTTWSTCPFLHWLLNGQIVTIRLKCLNLLLRKLNMRHGNPSGTIEWKGALWSLLTYFIYTCVSFYWLCMCTPWSKRIIEELVQTTQECSQEVRNWCCNYNSPIFHWDNTCIYVLMYTCMLYLFDLFDQHIQLLYLFPFTECVFSYPLCVNE